MKKSGHHQNTSDAPSSGATNKFPSEGADRSSIQMGDRAIVGQAQIAVSGDGNTIQLPQLDQKISPFPREAYLHHLFKRACYLPLTGIDPDAVLNQKDACVELNAVYTALMTHGAEASAPSDRQKGRRENLLSALSLLNRHDRLVLLGDPGGGKTTFTDFVALCLAGEGMNHKRINLKLLTRPLPDEKGEDEEAPQPWKHGPLLPVRLILREFVAQSLPPDQPGSAAHIQAHIKKELQAAGLEVCVEPLMRELGENGGLILLDGLDEVPEAGRRREQVIQAVQTLADSHPRCRFLVTSRTYAYQHQNWRLKGFHEAELAPFSKGQIIRFVDQWYAHVAQLRNMGADDARGRATLLKKAIFSKARIRELAQRPLLLTLMASLHAYRGGELPEQREELYHDTVNLLMLRWIDHKHIHGIDGTVKNPDAALDEWLETDKKQIRRMLEALAFKAHERQVALTGTADINETELLTQLIHISSRDDIRPKLLLKFISQRVGILAPHGDKVYTFPHRTFQEYLAACYLTGPEVDPALLPELAREAPDKWREVLLLAGAKKGRGDHAAVWSLANMLCYEPPKQGQNELPDLWGALLAGQLLLESADVANVKKWNRATQERIRDWQIEIMRGCQLPALERARAGVTLARMGDPRDEVMNVDAMQFGWVPAGPFYMGEEDGLFMNKAVDRDIWMGKYPVTQAQFDAFVQAGGYADATYWPEAAKAGFWRKGGFKGRFDNEFRSAPRDFGPPFTLPNHPVVGVAWYEALAFCRWLTQKWRNEKRLPRHLAVCLPCEADWEKAARGGETTPEKAIIRAIDDIEADRTVAGRPNEPNPSVYPWGDEADEDRANVEESGVNRTSAVGCFPKGQSPHGCQEMSGNVWEWTLSLSDDLSGDPRVDWEKIKNITPDSGIILKGGSWLLEQKESRCASRYWFNPLDSWDWLVGFRVLLSPFSSDL